MEYEAQLKDGLSHTVWFFSNDTKEHSIIEKVYEINQFWKKFQKGHDLAFFHIKLYQIWCTSLASTYIRMEQGISLKEHYFLWAILMVGAVLSAISEWVELESCGWSWMKDSLIQIVNKNKYYRIYKNIQIFLQMVVQNMLRYKRYTENVVIQ